MRTANDFPPLIASMLNPDVYPHAVRTLELIETHISWLILTGEYVYKIKKPVNLGFLDFSTLELRQRYCQEELRLNQRLAESIYLDVVAISGCETEPKLGDHGEPIEYALKMRQFDQSKRWDRLLEQGLLGVEHIDALAKHIARFHCALVPADVKSEFGDEQHVTQAVFDVIEQAQQHLHESADLDLLRQISQWCRKQAVCLKQPFTKRKEEGFIRECHGDMHLANLAWFNNAPLVFDCIEFNDNLRWIDVVSEVAFLIMDLDDQNAAALGRRFLNDYLEETGDYAGLVVLRFYLVYRALVRAMVAAIRSDQNPGESAISSEQCRGYLKLAEGYIHNKTPRLLILFGPSGSGKTWLSQRLLEQTNLIRLRSDVERKRLAGLCATDSAGAQYGQALYSSDVTQQTYDLLLTLSKTVLQANYSVIVDATFQDVQQRWRFADLAKQLGCNFAILSLKSDRTTLMERVRSRRGDASDANEQVLAQQLSCWCELESDELASAIEINTSHYTEESVVALAAKLFK